MAKLEKLDIGTVTAIEEVDVTETVNIGNAGFIGSLEQDLQVSRHSKRIVGFIDDPTQAEIEELKALRTNSNVCLLDITETTPEFKAFGRVRDIRIFHEEEIVDILDYELTFAELVSTSFMFLQTSECALTARGIAHERHMYYNPFWQQSNLTFTNSPPSSIAWEFWIYNIKTAEQTPIIEVFSNYYVNTEANGHVKIYYWDAGATTPAWVLIGDWGAGGADSWGTGKNFTSPYDGGYTHTMTANVQTRGGGAVSGMTPSLLLGNHYRLLFKLNMASAAANAYYVKLKVELIVDNTKIGHVLLRPEEYIDGSLKKYIP